MNAYYHGRHLRPRAITPQGLLKLRKWALVSRKASFTEHQRRQLVIARAEQNIMRALWAAMQPLIMRFSDPGPELAMIGREALDSLQRTAQENPEGVDADKAERITRTIASLQQLIADFSTPAD